MTKLEAMEKAVKIIDEIFDKWFEKEVPGKRLWEPEDVEDFVIELRKHCHILPRKMQIALFVLLAESAFTDSIWEPFRSTSCYFYQYSYKSTWKHVEKAMKRHGWIKISWMSSLDHYEPWIYVKL